MSIAPGTLIWDGASNWHATFTIDGQDWTFAADVDKALAQFPPITDAKLTYANTDQLTGTHTYKGTFGLKTVDLTLDNIPYPPTISGTFPTGAYTVTGTGVWEESEGI
jgi:hypothetical protein